MAGVSNNRFVQSQGTALRIKYCNTYCNINCFHVQIMFVRQMPRLSSLCEMRVSAFQDSSDMVIMIVSIDLKKIRIAYYILTLCWAMCSSSAKLQPEYFSISRLFRFRKQKITRGKLFFPSGVKMVITGFIDQCSVKICHHWYRIIFFGLILAKYYVSDKILPDNKT